MDGDRELIPGSRKARSSGERTGRAIRSGNPDRTVVKSKGKSKGTERRIPIQPGQAAPDFTLPAHDGTEVTLSSLRGEPVVIAFFPLAFSDVCSSQFGSLGERAEAYGSARVLAISVDSSLSQAAFAAQVGAEGVTFLSDFLPRGAVAEAYDIFVPERGHSGRAVLVVDAEGIVRATQYVHPLEVPDADGVRSAVAACGLG